MATYKNTRKVYKVSEKPAPVAKEKGGVYQLSFDMQAARLLGMQKPLSNDMLLAAATRKGIQKEKLTSIAQMLGLDQEELCRLLHMSVRTYQRLPAGSTLDVYSSEQAIELALVLAKAREIFADDNAIRSWFHAPLRGLNGQSPVSLMDTSFGARMVLNVLGKIEHGIYA